MPHRQHQNASTLKSFTALAQEVHRRDIAKAEQLRKARNLPGRKLWQGPKVAR
jgi:hypothetical protein